MHVLVAVDRLLVQSDDQSPVATMQKVRDIYEAIWEGAHSFLYAEYKYMAVFVAVFSVLIVVVIGVADEASDSWVQGVLTAVAFVAGSLTSILSGLLGMKIGVYANARTALRSRQSIGAGFQVAFKAGAVMGFGLVALGLLVAYVVIELFGLYYTELVDDHVREYFMEAVAGFGLGGSAIGMFGRVGGGIYTKAADVGADLVGKVEANIPEDDPRNPAVIADNVGDNVGDIAGMGADLFGSFGEATCAALVIGAQSLDLYLKGGKLALLFPLLVTATGIVGCILCTFYATHVKKVAVKADVEPSLKAQLWLSTIVMTPVLFAISWMCLPEEFEITGGDGTQSVKNYYVFFALAAGLWSGLFIGLITEYYTSHSYEPVREVSRSCETGAATNIIYGLALGYKSVIVPVALIGFVVIVGLELAGMYGVAMGALGILSTMTIGLTIDVYGPISDNAGGIAEMAELGEDVRDRTDALDAAGNTTAAIGKGFAIGSAALVSLALFGGFVTVTGIQVNLLNAFTFAGLLVGAMLPYWFSAMTMKSVGTAAFAMVTEVREQFRRDPGILQGTSKPDYARCIAISTTASLKEMVAPGALVMLTPLITGFVFGVNALAGVLAGSLVSGVQLAISASNTGGAWDNAKKWIGSGGLGEGKGKGSPEHVAAIIGDTVGDPLKDTSGPSLNILIKLSAIISLVFAKSFVAVGKQNGLLGLIFNWGGDLN
ncbi:MAG: hypothetical protein MHM6MM_004716 [Cercozoa sp. M6MM]